jgi:hypothetical protein
VIAVHFDAVLHSNVLITVTDDDVVVRDAGVAVVVGVGRVVEERLLGVLECRFYETLSAELSG